MQLPKNPPHRPFRQDGAKPSQIAVPDQAATIAQAIALAADHATITVRGGEYREALEISRPLNLLGAEAAEVVILAPSDQMSALVINNTKGVRLERLSSGILAT